MSVDLSFIRFFGELRIELSYQVCMVKKTKTKTQKNPRKSSTTTRMKNN